MSHWASRSGTFPRQCDLYPLPPRFPPLTVNPDGYGIYVVSLCVGLNKINTWFRLFIHLGLYWLVARPPQDHEDKVLILTGSPEGVNFLFGLWEMTPAGPETYSLGWVCKASFTTVWKVLNVIQFFFFLPQCINTPCLCPFYLPGFPACSSFLLVFPCIWMWSVFSWFGNERYFFSLISVSYPFVSSCISLRTLTLRPAVWTSYVCLSVAVCTWTKLTCNSQLTCGPVCQWFSLLLSIFTQSFHFSCIWRENLTWRISHFYILHIHCVRPSEVEAIDPPTDNVTDAVDQWSQRE